MLQAALHHLVSYFRGRLFDPELGCVKPLQFGDLADIVVLEGVASALAAVRDDTGRSPPEVVELLLLVLEEADGSTADVDDGNFRAHLLDALGGCRFEALLPQTEAGLEQEDIDEAQTEGRRLVMRVLQCLERCGEEGEKWGLRRERLAA